VTDYHLRPMTAGRLFDVAADWRTLAGEDEFTVELAAVFDWCATHLTPTENDAHAMELVDDDTGVTGAILEVITARRGRLSKMLKIYASPHFWTVDRDPLIKREVVELYAAAFVLMIADGISSGVDEIKIYGRTSQMLDILSSLETIWNSGDRSGWSATLAGRWLSIAPKA